VPRKGHPFFCVRKLLTHKVAPYILGAMTYEDIYNNYKKHTRGSASRLREYIKAFAPDGLKTEIDPEDPEKVRNHVAETYKPTPAEIDIQSVTILLHPKI